MVDSRSATAAALAKTRRRELERQLKGFRHLDGAGHGLKQRAEFLGSKGQLAMERKDWHAAIALFNAALIKVAELPQVLLARATHTQRRAHACK